MDKYYYTKRTGRIVVEKEAVAMCKLCEKDKDCVKTGCGQIFGDCEFFSEVNVQHIYLRGAADLARKIVNGSRTEMVYGKPHLIMTEYGIMKCEEELRNGDKHYSRS